MVLWLLVVLAEKLRKYGVLLHKTSIAAILAASMGCTERVPKPDMHGMERSELYRGC